MHLPDPASMSSSPPSTGDGDRHRVRGAVLANGRSGITLAALLIMLASPAAQQQQPAPDLRALQTQLRESNLRQQWRAMERLVQIGKPAVGILADLTVETDAKGLPRSSARTAAEGLKRLGAKATAALPKLTEAYTTGSVTQARLLLTVIGRIGRHDPSRAELTHKIFQNRGRNKGKRRRSVPTHDVVACLLRLNEGPKQDQDHLMTLVQGDSAVHIEIGLDGLLELVESGKAANPELRRKFAEIAAAALLRGRVRRSKFSIRSANWGWSGSLSSRDDQGIRFLAAQLLSRLGHAGDTQLRQATHQAMLKHDNPAQRQRHALALGSLGRRADAKAATALLPLLSDPDKLVAWDAITAMGMLGRHAKRLRPYLRDLSTGGDKAKAARATAALQMIERDMAKSGDGKG